MAHNTTRLGLNVVDGTDNVSNYPTVDAQAKGILDNAVTFSSGTLAARPAAALNGRVYYATDTGLYYEDNGSAWGTVLVAGAWTALTLRSGVVAYTSTVPAARFEGDIVRLRGQMQNNSGGSLNGQQWVTGPASYFPALGNITLPGGITGGTGTAPIIISGGITVGGLQANLNVINLDGIAYTIYQ